MKKNIGAKMDNVIFGIYGRRGDSTSKTMASKIDWTPAVCRGREAGQHNFNKLILTYYNHSL